MPRIRAGARNAALGALALVVTASVATVAGVSAADDRLADSLTTKAAAAANNTTITALSRRRGHTDIVYVGAQGRIHAASRGPDGDWFTQNLNRGEAAPNTKVSGVKRYNGRLDVFAVGTDRRVYTALLDEGIDGQGTATWRGWFEIPGGLKVLPDSSVNVVSTNRDTMDLFAVNEARQPYTIRWTAQGEWGSWQSLSTASENFRTGRGTEITAAAVGRDIHIFTGRANSEWTADHQVHTRHYVEGQGWGVWERLDPSFAVNPTSEIVPVVRVSAIDIFVVSSLPAPPSYPEPQVLTATWNGEFWSKLTTLLDRSPRLGSSVTGVARNRTRNLDAFLVAADGRVLTAAWTAGGQWNGWWSLDGGVASGTSVAVHSDGVDDIQIFVLGDLNAVFPVWTRRWSSATGWTAWENVGP